MKHMSKNTALVCSLDFGEIEHTIMKPVGSRDFLGERYRCELGVLDANATEYRVSTDCNVDGCAVFIQMS